jgi:hypothetical protein
MNLPITLSASLLVLSFVLTYIVPAAYAGSGGYGSDAQKCAMEKKKFCNK